MQTIELVGFMDNQHEMHLKLPEQAQIGRAKVIFLYEENEAFVTKCNLDGFLDCLPRNQIGRSHEDILLQVQEERDCWQD